MTMRKAERAAEADRAAGAARPSRPADKTTGGPGRALQAPRLARGWAWLVDGLAALGTVMIAALMAVIFADVLARNISGGSLPLVAELGALGLVMIVFLQLGSAVRHDRLARADLLYAPLRDRAPRLGATIGALFAAAGCAMTAIMAWSTFGILRRDLDYGEFIGVVGVLTLPVWPFRALILLGIAVAAIQFALLTLAEARRAAGSGGR